MKIFKINQKALYVLSSILIAFLLYGCKEKEVNVSVFDSLPESTFLTEMKTSLENHIPIAVAFTAEWCPHCRQYKPVFNEVKDLYRNKITFINIDVDDANGSPISNRFQVRGIPTSAFIRADGSVFKVQVGEISKDELVKISDELIVNKKRKKGEPVAPFPLDIKKEEAAPEEPKQPVKEEAKPEEVKPEEIKQEESKPEETPSERVVPPLPPQEEPQGGFGGPPSLEEPSDKQIQLPEPSEDDQDSNLDSESDSNDGEEQSLPEQEAAPGQ